MRADVAKRRRSEKRVYHGVDQHIAVGMRLEAVAFGDDHPAENKGLPALEDV